MGRNKNCRLARLRVKNLENSELKLESLTLSVLVPAVVLQRVTSLLLQPVLLGTRLRLPVLVLLCTPVIVIHLTSATVSLVMENLATSIAGFVTPAVIQLSTPKARVGVAQQCMVKAHTMSNPSHWVFRFRQSSPCWRPGWRMPRRIWRRNRR